MKKRGQSVLEYVIMLTAIVAVILAGVALTATGFGTKDETGGLGKILKQSASTIETKTAEIGSMVNQ